MYSYNHNNRKEDIEELEKKRRKVLSKLRNKNPVVSHYVKLAMSYVYDTDLVFDGKNCIIKKRIKELRIANGLTCKDLETLLECSHSTINDLELIDSSLKSIDRFFVEAFSFIYNVSPLYILGIIDNDGQYSLSGSNDECKRSLPDEETVKNLLYAAYNSTLLSKKHESTDECYTSLDITKPLIDPMYVPSNDAKNIAQTIVRNLFEHQNRDSFELLLLIVQLCCSSKSTINSVINLIENTPIYKKDLYCKYITQRKTANNFFDFSQKNYECTHFLNQCVKIIIDYAEFNKESAEVLANITLSQNKRFLKALHDWLLEGEYLKDGRRYKKRIKTDDLHITDDGVTGYISIITKSQKERKRKGSSTEDIIESNIENTSNSINTNNNAETTPKKIKVSLVFNPSKQ